mgnify:CR=1 FL=1
MGVTGADGGVVGASSSGAVGVTAGCPTTCGADADGGASYFVVLV